jgi:hypothetical protein
MLEELGKAMSAVTGRCPCALREQAAGFGHKEQKKNCYIVDQQINRPSGTGSLFSFFQALRARLLSFVPPGQR